MTGRLDGKAAIITGAGSGIGLAIARLFAAEGARVVVADVSGREAAVADELGPPAFAFHFDVADERQAEALIDAAVKRFGRVDIVCNNAGLGGELASVHETRLETIDEVLRVNLRGSFVMMQKSIAQMLRSGGGAIVNTASIASFQSTPGHSIYSASKGGVMQGRRTVADFANLLSDVGHHCGTNAVCSATNHRIRCRVGRIHISCVCPAASWR